MKIFDIINNKNLISGKWIDCTKTIKIYNPANNQIVGTIPDLNQEGVYSSIISASDSFKTWSQTNAKQRIEILKNWHGLIIDNIDELAYILTLEQGKTLEDSKREVMYATSFVDWFASTLNSIQGSIKPGNNRQHKMITEYEPIGPVAAITPWNFPCAMVTRKVAPAIIAGCTVVLKPSEFTPLSALALGKLAIDAGLPAGVLNIITGDPALIGKILCNDFRIRKLSFTGSTRVGKILYQNCSNSLKRISLELGGNAPFIIFKDCDLDKVADDLLNVKIRTAGQSCTAPNRIFIQQEVYNKFINIFIPKFSVLKIGDGLNPNSDICPLINRDAVDKILNLINDATSKGGKLLCGGNAKDNFIEATAISECTDNMALFSTEIFGPVVAFYSFIDEKEVINRANNTEYGLQSYVYTKDLELASRMTAVLDYGIVTVNSAFASNCRATFSGRKASGFGIEGGDEGIFEYLNPKYINWELP
jgi:succinate-semialdehyde dehydrogenase/glutarate-semialdehyde dehydrogenase